MPARRPRGEGTGHRGATTMLSRWRGVPGAAGTLAVWPLEELLADLAGRPVAVQRLREEFAAWSSGCSAACPTSRSDGCG